MARIIPIIALLSFTQISIVEAQAYRGRPGPRSRYGANNRYQRSSFFLNPLQKKFKERFFGKDYQSSLLLLNGITRTPGTSSPFSLGGAIRTLAREKLARSKGVVAATPKKSHVIGGDSTPKKLTREEQKLVYARNLIAAMPDHIKRIKEVAKACNGEFKNITNQNRYGKWEKSFAYQCQIARDWENAFKKAAVVIMANEYANFVATVNRAIKDMEKGEGFIYAPLAKFFTSPKDIEKKLNMTAVMLEKLLQVPVDKKGTAKKAKVITVATSKTLQETASTRKWLGKKYPYHKKAVERVARKNFKKRFPGVVVKKTGLYERKWSYTKNHIGIILNRYHTGAALIKLKHEKWCRMMTFKYTEERKTGNRYRSNDFIWVFSEIRYQQCR
ncbi:hypothetical protein KKF84_16105 [Myxococcota bacterium]|nr:hypothetical protein [Myxococcota bacterium]MBU1536850.1 hypothetical protein [Myxococcota bacterium]